MSFLNVGKVWDEASFREHVSHLDLSRWQGITMHHTYSPDLAMRPRGLTIQHIRNIADFYRGKGWSTGPHLFVDDDEIFGMTPLEERGIHAKSFNATHLGIEVLGDFDLESPSTGRGADCWNTAATACGILLQHMGKSVDVINGHRDDPRSHKSCPGLKVDLESFKELVEISMDDRGGPQRPDVSSVIREIHDNIAWQLKKLNKLAN